MKIRLLIMLAALCVVCGAGVASAQNAVRFTPSFEFADNFDDAQYTFIHLPSVNTVGSVQLNYTVETGERVHDCRLDSDSGLAPGAGNHTVWVRLGFPGGTLTLDTAGSNYDTVMSVYKPAGAFADLQTVACNDDNPAGGVSTSKIARHFPAGVYYVQISRWSSALTGTSSSLTLSASAVLDGKAPKNDNFANARPLILGQTITTRNIEFATSEPTEPNSACAPEPAPMYSVWYVVDPGPYGIRLNISLEGSRLDYGGLTMPDTVLEVFEGPGLGALVSKACNDDTHVSASALSDFEGTFSATLYIRVSASSQYGLTGPSSYRLRVTAGFYGTFGTNSSFENAVGSEWKQKNISSDGRVCAVGVGFLSDCAYEFVGGPGEKSSLKQSFTLPANLRIKKSQQIYTQFAVEALSPATRFKAAMTVSYTDGTPPTTESFSFVGSPSPNYLIYTLMIDVKSAKVGKIQLAFTNKSTGGTLLLDFITTSFIGGYTRDARSAPDSLLPLPMPPRGLATGRG